jgi:hypothetical protein
MILPSTSSFCRPAEAEYSLTACHEATRGAAANTALEEEAAAALDTAEMLEAEGRMASLAAGADRRMVARNIVVLFFLLIWSLW